MAWPVASAKAADAIVVAVAVMAVPMVRMGVGVGLLGQPALDVGNLLRRIIQPAIEQAIGRRHRRQRHRGSVRPG